MAVSIALSVMAVSPLLMAHLFIRPSAQQARRLRARSAVHRRLAQLQAEELELHHHINDLLG
jgi:cell division protein FtsB